MNKTDKKNAPLYVEMVENAGGGSKMIVMKPKSFDDIQTLITNLAGGQSVIFNLEEVSKESAQRMLDFMAGAAFALGGSMQRIENTMFLVTAKGVGIQIK
jgi:cell division inhibitor SepF